MGDAVLRVRSRLQRLALDHWSTLEEKHVHNRTWLRDELTQIARSLEIKACWEQSGGGAWTPFSSGWTRWSSPNDAVDVAGPARKKPKMLIQEEDATAAPGTDRERRTSSRGSMRLRPRTVSVETTVDAGRKTTRKRGRPSPVLLRDPDKLKVVELRLALKTRGLSTSGRKRALVDRLLDALEVEQQETDRADGVTVHESEVVVIKDDSDGDDIVRESIESNKSSRSVVTSHVTLLNAAAEEEKETTATGKDGQYRSFVPARDDAVNTDCVVRRVNRPFTSETAPQADPAEERQLSSEPHIASRVGNSRDDVELVVADSAEELIGRDVLTQMIRKSMQVGGKSELTSPLAWKRKSILRKASSLAPSTHGSVRNVSFAPTDMIDTIIESSQTDSTQPDPSPEKVSSPNEPHTPRDDSKVTESDFSIESNARLKTVSTYVAPFSASLSPQDPAPTISIEETEEQRKKREFDETVQREAEKLRLAAKLSAQKRLEEARASKALWAKGDQLKARLRASSAGDRRKSVRTPLPLNEKSASDQVSPPISESSTASERTSTASDPIRMTASVSKGESRILDTTRLAIETAKDHDFMRSMARKQETKSISDVLSGYDSSLHDFKVRQATNSVVDDQYQVERSISHRRVDMPASKPTPATEKIPQEAAETHSARLDIESQQLQRPSFLSPTTSRMDATPSETPKLHSDESVPNRNRSDSLSSTVSSIPEQSTVENTLKSGSLPLTNGNRRPIANLVSGLHSFTTLLEKKNTQEGNSVRIAPVINALKLAEKSRVLEEKKRLEKEGRKAILKKKMEEHKKVAALKEKAEKDAQAKRELERLNVRKKREAELARQRQQKLKEMRAGLEKKRAMLAAEKKAIYASSGALSSKSTTSATVASHYKHRGLASTSGIAQPTAKPMSKPLEKFVAKPIPKPVSNLPLATKPAPKPMSKPVSRPPMTSSVPAKHAPKSHSPDIVNYEMSDNVESSDGDSGDSDADRHGKKKVPRWAQKDHLNKALHTQFGKNAIDPSPAIFQDFVDTCNLEAIFETDDIRKKKKFTRRTSSGNWLADRPTARDRALYQRDMGYDR